MIYQTVKHTKKTELLLLGVLETLNHDKNTEANLSVLQQPPIYLTLLIHVLI